MPNYVPIPRVHRLSEADFRATYLYPQKPVVLTGAIDDWRALEAWDMEWFRSFPGTQVLLGGESTYTTAARAMPFPQYIDSVIDGTHGGLYMAQFPFTFLPELFDYVTRPLVEPEREAWRNLWIGPSGTDISFHKDSPNKFDLVSNLFAQVRGRKRVWLVSPDQDEAMYPRRADDFAPRHTQVDHNNPDYARFPLYRDVTVLETVLGPGEMIFIPGDYWHSLRGLDPSVSVSMFWHTYAVFDVLASYLRAKEAGTPFTRRLTDADVEEFGGAERLAQALPLLSEAERTALAELFEPAGEFPRYRAWSRPHEVRNDGVPAV